MQYFSCQNMLSQCRITIDVCDRGTLPLRGFLLSSRYIICGLFHIYLFAIARIFLFSCNSEQRLCVTRTYTSSVPGALFHFSFRLPPPDIFL